MIVILILTMRKGSIMFFRRTFFCFLQSSNELLRFLGRIDYERMARFKNGYCHYYCLFFFLFFFMNHFIRINPFHRGSHCNWTRKSKFASPTTCWSDSIESQCTHNAIRFKSTILSHLIEEKKCCWHSIVEQFKVHVPGQFFVLFSLFFNGACDFCHVFWW